MKIRRWLSVLLMGSLAGAIWAAVWVDITPRWFDRLGTVPAVSLMLVPVALSVACGIAVKWWRLRICLGYGAVVVAWHLAGELHNKLANPGRVSGFDAYNWLGFGAELGLIVGGWYMGRFACRLRDGEFGPGAGNPPADPELIRND